MSNVFLSGAHVTYNTANTQKRWHQQSTIGNTVTQKNYGIVKETKVLHFNNDLRLRAIVPEVQMLFETLYAGQMRNIP